MPAIATENNRSTGACGKTPTLPIGPFTSTVTFSGRKVQWRGVTVYNDHPDLITHHGSRTVKASQATPSTFFLEGHPVAFESDLLDDNDAIAPLEGNTSFG
jgi:hypothetical protein